MVAKANSVKRRMNDKIEARRASTPKECSATDDICETVFINGPNSCNKECGKKHNLDFQRIRRGNCHHNILGTCRWNDRCLFTHEVPESIKKSSQATEAAQKFVESSRRYDEKDGNTQRLSKKAISTSAVVEHDITFKQGNDPQPQHREIQPILMPQHQLQSSFQNPFLWDTRRTLQDQTTAATLLKPHPIRQLPPFPQYVQVAY